MRLLLTLNISVLTVRNGCRYVLAMLVPRDADTPCDCRIFPARKAHKDPHSDCDKKPKKKPEMTVKQPLRRRDPLFATFMPDGSKVTQYLSTERSKENKTVKKAAVIRCVAIPAHTLLRRRVDSLHNTRTSAIGH